MVISCNQSCRYLLTVPFLWPGESLEQIRLPAEDPGVLVYKTTPMVHGQWGRKNLHKFNENGNIGSESKTALFVRIITILSFWCPKQ